MNKSAFFTSFLAIGVLSLFLYRYIDEQNQVTELLLSLPQLEREIHEIEEENARLRFSIERWESPSHLLELARQNEYTHLKMPITSEVLTLAQPTTEPAVEQEQVAVHSSSLAIAAK